MYCWKPTDDGRFRHGDSKVVEIYDDFLVRTTFSTSDKYREKRWLMTKWNKLLVMLGQVFGFQTRKKSSVKKRHQAFDEKTNEHVFILEYRVVKGEHSDPKQREEASIKLRVNHKEHESLLQDRNDRVQMGFPETG
jgi:hypothetical protein